MECLAPPGLRMVTRHCATLRIVREENVEMLRGEQKVELGNTRRDIADLERWGVGHIDRKRQR
jgi:hypothetical protein